MYQSTRGYTLIEILIVVFIISIVTGMALMKIRYNNNQTLEREARTLWQTLTLAEEEAMLAPVILGFNVNDHAYQFLNLHQAQDKKWLPSSNKLLAYHSLPQQVELILQKDEKNLSLNTDKPQIIIGTNGGLTPFTILLANKGQKPRYAIIGKADGSIIRVSLS